MKSVACLIALFVSVQGFGGNSKPKKCGTQCCLKAGASLGMCRGFCSVASTAKTPTQCTVGYNAQCCEWKGNATQSSCTDFPVKSVDNYGSTCKSYVQNKWCTATGKPGSGWDKSWGTAIAPSAAKYCCGCGGGAKPRTTPPTKPKPTQQILKNTMCATNHRATRRSYRTLGLANYYCRKMANCSGVYVSDCTNTRSTAYLCASSTTVSTKLPTKGSVCDPVKGPKSGMCPMARCMKPPTGCTYKTVYALGRNGCCPKLCYQVDLKTGKQCTKVTQLPTMTMTKKPIRMDGKMDGMVSTMDGNVNQGGGGLVRGRRMQANGFSSSSRGCVYVKPRQTMTKRPIKAIPVKMDGMVTTMDGNVNQGGVPSQGGIVRG